MYFVIVFFKFWGPMAPIKVNNIVTIFNPLSLSERVVLVWLYKKKTLKNV